MTLLADWQATIPEVRRSRLSNIDDSTPSAPDTAFETLVATQAEGLFLVNALASYSSSNPKHVALGIKLMMNLMQFYTSRSDENEDHLNATIAQLGNLSLVLQQENDDFAVE